MELQRIVVDRRGAVCRILLSGTPMAPREARELESVTRELVEDRDLRILVLTSAGEDFCPGADEHLDPLAPGSDPTVALAAIRVPVVAVLRGRTASVGLEIALTADLRLAAPDTVCSLPEIIAGRLPSWGGTQRLPRLVGAAEALRLLLLGESVEAPRAAGIGLVHEVVEDPGARAQEIIGQWLARGPLALEYAKEAVLAGAELPVREGLALEADLNTLLQTSADRAEGLAAFNAKRLPTFTGR